MLKKLIKMRDFMRQAQSHALLNFKTIEENYMIPVNLYRLTQDYSTNKENIDLNPIDIDKAIEDFLDDYEYRLITMCRPNDKYMKENDRALKTLFELALHQFLSPSKCIYQYGLTKEKFGVLMKDIKDQYIKAIVEPGEGVGVIAAQSVGEPATQLTLNVKHSAAGGKKGGGVGRVEELINYSKNIKDPQMTIYFEPSISSDRSAVNKIVSYFKHLTIKELISNAEIYYDLSSSDTLSKKLKADNVSGPFFVNNQKADISSLPFVFRLTFNLEKLLDKETTLLDIKTKFVSYWYKNFTNIKSMKKNEKAIFTRVSRCAILSSSPTDKEQVIHIRFNMTSFSYSMLTDFLEIVMNDITLKGMEKIEDVFTGQEMISKYDNDGAVKMEKEFTCITNGINMEKLKLIKGIDMTRSRCNDTATILRTYGIEATRQILLYEIRTTYSDSGANINQNHLSLLVDQMCHLGEIVSIDRHGMNKLDSDPITRASFEKTMEHFERAAVFNETDTLKSVSSRVAMGRVIPSGTGMFDLLLDTNRLENSEYSQDETGGHITFQPLEEEPLLNDIMKYGFGNADFFAPVLTK
jgi:DNA-directed RNA polymerase II subunit RPB1